MNKLSEYLSPVCVLVLITRCLSSWPNLGWPEAVGLVLVLAIHYAKGLAVSTTSRSFKEEELKDQINQIVDNVSLLESKISGINLQLGIRTTEPESEA